MTLKIFALCLSLASLQLTTFAKKDVVTTGSLSISTAEPSSAAVFINSEHVGNTPTTIANLKPGKYIVELSATGYQKTYNTIIINAGEETSYNTTLEKNKGMALITSIPSGATVKQDGIDIGTTPILAHNLDFKNYTYEFSLNGYKPQKIMLDVNSVRPNKVNAELVSLFADINITSTPSDAIVTLNGNNIGKTPCSTQVAEGIITIVLDKPGYKKHINSITATAGVEQNINAILEEIAPIINIISIPSNARVYINNQYKGNTPLECKDLHSGSHRVRVEMGGYDISARNIIIEPGDTKTHEFRLKPNAGSLSVVTSPANVEITINGKSYGKTFADEKEESSDSISLPFTAEGIPIGTHEVIFAAPGYKSIKKTLAFERDKINEIGTVILQRLFIPDYEIRTDSKTYRGVFIEKRSDCIILETSPGVRMSFSKDNIIHVRTIKTNVE